jgi:hypothetical protein
MGCALIENIGERTHAELHSRRRYLGGHEILLRRYDLARSGGERPGKLVLKALAKLRSARGASGKPGSTTCDGFAVEMAMRICVHGCLWQDDEQRQKRLEQLHGFCSVRSGARAHDIAHRLPWWR